MLNYICKLVALTDVIGVSEVVYGLESSGIVQIVCFECDPEEVSVGDEGLRTMVFRIAAHPGHLAVSQTEVEVGQFDEITLRFIETAMNNNDNNTVLYRPYSTQCNAIQSDTAHCNTVLYNALPCYTIMYYTILDSTMLYNAVPLRGMFQLCYGTGRNARRGANLDTE